VGGVSERKVCYYLDKGKRGELRKFYEGVPGEAGWHHYILSSTQLDESTSGTKSSSSK